MPVEIKAIEMKFFDGFYAALDAVAKERRFLSAEQAPPYEGGAHFVANNIKTGNPQFIALDGSDVVGWCDVCRRSNTFFQHCGTLGMGVLLQYRGKGIGSRLLDATMAAAWKRGLTRVELEVFDTNAAALALYRKHGFVLEGTRRGAAEIDGVGIDIHVMAVLNPEG